MQALPPRPLPASGALKFSQFSGLEVLTIRPRPGLRETLAVIRRMAIDLNFRTRVIACPTVREADGLGSRLDPHLPMIVVSGQGDDVARVRAKAKACSGAATRARSAA